jgi:hypothetical protein
MDMEQISRISMVRKLLDEHNHSTEESDGRVYVRSWFTLQGVPDFEDIDITDWTVEDANKWLGY